MTDRDLMQQALEALVEHEGNYKLGNAGCDRHIKATTALRERLAQPEQPPQRTWVGLTIEEIAACCRESTTTQLSFAKNLEAKLKERNT